MSPNRHAQLFEAFDRLCDASAPTRREELSRLEAEDPAFAAELAALLEIDADTQQPLTEEVRAQAQAAIVDRDVMPQRIGRFEIERRLGAGGMGVVYAGRDPMLRRDVAVKVLARPWGSETALRRARREAQAMAQVSDPHVVSVYGIGDHEGALYIAMERIHGQTLAAWQATPRSWQALLEVYRQAGLGLAALHARGLVHRDFKPANAMRGEDGRVRVLDLGLVRELAVDTKPSQADPDVQRRLPTDSNTVSHAMIGTPAYMAPEQLASGPVGPAADQFAFCVALFEALYGTRPFPAETVNQLVAAIATGQIVDVPRTRVPRSVHTALCRGLAHDPRQRHRSMEALLDALVPRSSSMFVLGGVAALAVLFGSLPALSGSDDHCELATDFDRIWTPTRRATVRGALTEGDPAFAATQAYAETLGDRVRRECAAREATQACTAQLVQRFDQVLRFLVEAPEGLPASELVASLPPPHSCDDAPSGIPTDPHEDAAIAGELQKAAAVVLEGDLDRALEVAQSALRRAQAQGNPATTEQAFHQRGSIHAQRHDLTAATNDLTAAYEIAVARGDQVEVAELALGLAWAAKERSAYLDARHWLRIASSAYQAQDAPDPATHARLLLRRGELAANEGKMAEAHEALLEAVEAWSALDNPYDLSTSLSLLGWAEMAVGELERAIGFAERSVEVLKDAAGPDDPRLATLLGNLGNLYQLDHDLEAAEAALAEVVRLRESTLGPEHSSTAMARYALATVLFDRGEFSEADDLLRAVQEHAPAGHPLIAAATMTSAAIASEREEHDEALRLANRARVAIEEHYGATHLHSGEARANLAKLELRAGRWSEGLTNARAAREVLEETLGPHHMAVVKCVVHEVDALQRLGRADEAHARGTAALQSVVESKGEDSPEAKRLREALD